MKRFKTDKDSEPSGFSIELSAEHNAIVIKNPVVRWRRQTGLITCYVSMMVVLPVVVTLAAPDWTAVGYLLGFYGIMWAIKDGSWLLRKWKLPSFSIPRNPAEYIRNWISVYVKANLAVHESAIICFLKTDAETGKRKLEISTYMASIDEIEEVIYMLSSFADDAERVKTIEGWRDRQAAALKEAAS